MRGTTPTKLGSPMRTAQRALIVLATISLCACSTLPSTPPTQQVPPPDACLQKCQPLPMPTSASDEDVRAWEHGAIRAAGACIALHADCVEWLSRLMPSPFFGGRN